MKRLSLLILGILVSVFSFAQANRPVANKAQPMSNPDAMMAPVEGIVANPNAAYMAHIEGIIPNPEMSKMAHVEGTVPINVASQNIQIAAPPADNIQKNEPKATRSLQRR